MAINEERLHELRNEFGSAFVHQVQEMIDEIRCLQSEEEILRDVGKRQLDKVYNLRTEIASLQSSLASMQVELGKMKTQEKELPEDVRHFIYHATLEIQSHRSRTDKQKDELFQMAYRLYAKYDVEGHEKKYGQKGATT